MKVIDALRISTGFPLIFTPIKINNHYFADGGIVCPIECNGLTKKEINESIAIIIHKGFTEYNTDSLDKYIVALLSSLLDSLMETLITRLKYKIIINLPVFSMDLNISEKQKEEMVNIGKKEAENFINKIKLKKTKNRIYLIISIVIVIIVSDDHRHRHRFLYSHRQHEDHNFQFVSLQLVYFLGKKFQK